MCSYFQLDYGTWKSTLTIESVLNSDYTVYQCIATNALGEDIHNITLTSPNIPDPPLNLEVAMKDYKTVRLKVRKSKERGYVWLNRKRNILIYPYVRRFEPKAEKLCLAFKHSLPLN